MATITPVSTKCYSYNSESFAVQWTPVTSADTASAIEVPAYAKVAVQIAGTFDSATVVLQGSIDSTNFVALTDPQGNTISKTVAALEQVEEVVRYIKPAFSGGAGSQSLTVTIYLGRK